MGKRGPRPIFIQLLRVQLKPEQKTLLRDLAYERDCTVSELVRKLIEELEATNGQEGE